MKDDFYSFLPSWNVPTSVIHNPLTHIPPFISDLPKKTIITIGRLEKQKNHKLLILAYNKIKDVIPHNLVIIGEGSERSILEQLINNNGLKQRVFLKGYIDDPWLEYKNSALFVLTSNYEGFPNVLIEAMANSTPVISSDCPSGPKGIIQDHVNGLLFPVGNVDILANLISSNIVDHESMKKYKENAYAYVERYKIGSIMSIFKKIISR
jgi:glycosyltransferase involved in cell wall biosynthesis